jgi:predicted dehydrogenase
VKIAIIGYGSIGKRHAENLKGMGHEIIPLDLNYKLRFDVDCAFICTPTQSHVEIAVQYIDKNVPIFIEKPITYCLEELNWIEREIKKNHVLSMVACNNRFHPSILKAKAIADTKKVIFARAEAGYYLPFWRKTDYKKSYSASEYGGIVLDDIHSVDYLYWLFGKIKDIKTVCGKVSDLDIKKEDIAEIAIMFESGVSASVHCDYLLKNYHKQLSLYLPHETITFKIQPTNLMYKKEEEYFISCLERKVEPMNNIMEAVDVLRCVLSSKGGGNNSGTNNLNTTT